MCWLYILLGYTTGPFVQGGGAFVSPGVDVSSVRHSKMHANAVFVQTCGPRLFYTDSGLERQCPGGKNKTQVQGDSPSIGQDTGETTECHLTHGVWSSTSNTHCLREIGPCLAFVCPYQGSITVFTYLMLHNKGLDTFQVTQKLISVRHSRMHANAVFV